MNVSSDAPSWMYGLFLIVATITIHATGIVSMALVGNRVRLRLESRRLSLSCVMAAVIVVVAVIGTLLCLLHGTEAAIWATAYVRLGAFAAPSDAMLFSLGALTTVGAPGLVLQRHWQMMGVLEAGNGAVLFGISTAYIFGVMQVYWPLLRVSK